MDVRVGDTVEGRYRLLDTLGEGGAGKVFLAEHVLIKRRLAVKILHTRYASDASVLERFMNEARAAGTLGHPNIVESTDMGFTSDGVPYIVFEYLEGSSLTDEIYRLRGLPVRRALKIAHQIASALDAAHTAGIIHRDLKSDNIFLTDRDQMLDHVKVLDFGVSRFMENDLSDSQILGTPEYMAPEQITTPELVDARADVYALGVILYEMIAGQCPFRADHDPHAVLHQVLHDAPPRFNKAAVKDLPSGLTDTILTKMLAKDPSERFASMKDVSGAIEAFQLIVHPMARASGSIPFPLEENIDTQPVAKLPPPATVVNLPNAPRASRAPLWLATALLVGGAGFVVQTLDKPRTVENSTSRAGIEGDAKLLAAHIDGVVRAAHQRADGIASTPMLRAAIETDAATMTDMANTESVFAPKGGEVIEVFHIRDATLVSWLQIPTRASKSRSLQGNETTLDQTSKGAMIAAVASPITTQKGETAGSLVLTVPVDLGGAEGLKDHATTATLVGVGLGKPITLRAGAPGPMAVDVFVPTTEVPATLRIAATIQPPTIVPPRLGPIRLVLWGISGLLGIGFVASLLRGRARR